MTHAVRAGLLVALPVRQAEFERRRAMLLSLPGRVIAGQTRQFLLHVATALGS